MRALLAFAAAVLLAGCGGGGRADGGGGDGAVRVTVRFPNADYRSPNHVNQGPTVPSWVRYITVEAIGSGEPPFTIAATELSEHVRTVSGTVPRGVYNVRLRMYQFDPAVGAKVVGEKTLSVTVGENGADLDVQDSIPSDVVRLGYTHPLFTPPQHQPSSLSYHGFGSDDVWRVNGAAATVGFKWTKVSGVGTVTPDGWFVSDEVGMARVRVQDLTGLFTAETDVDVQPAPPPPPP